MFILLFFAMLSGLVTVLSPCILPVLPVLLSAGIGQGRYRSFGVIIGLIFSFSFFTLTLTALVHATGISPDILRYGAIILITFFGLTLLFPQLGDWFAGLLSGVASIGNIVQEKSNRAGTGFLSGLILGCALGLLWTPCAGPILAAITTLVATREVVGSTVLLTVAYSIGAALPMFLIMYGGTKIIHSTTIVAGYTEIIRKSFGVLMILGALAIAFHADVMLQQFAVKYFPMIVIEDNAVVKKELEKLRAKRTTNNGVAHDTIQTSKAPDFVGIKAWINSPELSIATLRGNVVLVDFWTYSCINCIRTLPYLKKWYADYKDKGLVIVGVHTPEFEFEKNLHNVKDAVKRFEIHYPVALDNDYKTWRNYNNNYWPAHYLIDQHGIIQETHFGEGGYNETENAIRTLLGLAPLVEKVERMNGKQLTPETYLGYQRADRYQSEIVLKNDQEDFYDYHNTLEEDHIGLKGSWFIGSDFIQAKSDASVLDLNFIANRVYLVMGAVVPSAVTVLLDDQPIPAQYYTNDMNKNRQILVSEARMYDIIDLKDNYGRHKLTLKFPKDVMVYAFTFGGNSK